MPERKELLSLLLSLTPEELDLVSLLAEKELGLR